MKLIGAKKVYQKSRGTIPLICDFFTPSRFKNRPELNGFKGTVQRELTGIEIDNQKLFFSH
jgi:hypothetical protein